MKNPLGFRSLWTLGANPDLAKLARFAHVIPETVLAVKPDSAPQREQIKNMLGLYFAAGIIPDHVEKREDFEKLTGLLFH